VNRRHSFYTPGGTGDLAAGVPLLHPPTRISVGSAGGKTVGATGLRSLSCFQILMSEYPALPLTASL
jgi:hypothetical protein